MAARTEYAADPEQHPALVTALGVSVPVAVLLVVMWAIHLRPHDSSARAATPMLGVALLVLVSSLLPYAELIVGVLLAVLVVIETRAADRPPIRSQLA